MVSLRRGHGADVVRITTAPESHEAEMAHRQKRYMISMGIRTVCFVLAVVTHGWVRWVLIFLALTLPYVSVVFANGGRERIEQMPDAHLAQDRRAIDDSQG